MEVRRETVTHYPRVTLEAARVNAHLLQRDAAEKLGISVETLRSYETGKTSPTMEMVEKISRVYQFPSEYIFFG